MSSDLAVASAVSEIAPGRYRATIPDAWQQGRGAFGGLVLAILLRAIEAGEAAAAATTTAGSEPARRRTTRTLAGDLCGPALPGPAEIVVRALRRGNNQSNLAAELTQEGVVVATATAVLSPARLATGDGRATPPFSPPAAPPASAPWSEVAVSPIGPPLGPVFTQHYEYRPTSGGPTGFAAVGEPYAEGWIRERVTLAALDAPALVGRLDAWWPTLFAIDGALRPVATISFSAQMLADLASLPAAEPLRYRARMVALYEGFFVELRELWRGDRVVALNQQTFAILR
ncbi:MAG: TesB-like acyl-CoA thioesterase 1 [bacterium]|nr:TesB-like acyl-CoA thioesterase 1 [bacterium]